MSPAGAWWKPIFKTGGSRPQIVDPGVTPGGSCWRRLARTPWWPATGPGSLAMSPPAPSAAS
eukprot:16451732-Heterocapsa_arctica.AAC.1